MGIKRVPFAFLPAALIVLASCSDSNPIVPDTKPAVPASVTATATSANNIRVTWSAANNATGYIIQRAPTGGAFTRVGKVTTTTFDDSGLQPSTQYRYQVASFSVTDTSAFAAEIAGTTRAAGSGATVILTGNITTNRTLTADTVYVLNGFVKVRAPAVLTIQPGTKIVGDTTVAGSSLWITRGAKISAIGTATAPIVFTSQRAVNNRLPGDWGGIVIVGNGLVNRSAGGGVASMFTEGPQGTGQNTGENYGGGTDNADNSGTLKYVRVEFAGYAVLQDQELNSISSYAVGSGTQYDYVESLAGLDDSFEFFGGAVDIRHMISLEAGDDHFDWTEGYAGRGQFLIAVQTTLLQPRQGAGFLSTDPRGFEGDNCEIDKAGCTGFGVKPVSSPVWANFTVLGPGPTVFGRSDGNGAVLRRGSGGYLVNGIIARWPGRAINIRDVDFANNLIAKDSIVLRNLIFADNGANFDPDNDATVAGQKAKFATANIQEMTGANALFTSIPAINSSPADITGFDFTPSATSAARTGGLTTFTGLLATRVSNFFGGTLQGTAYIGAVDPSGADKWWQGWTYYATK